MTEQLEDDFWAAARAQAAAARGQHADPGACGTCRGNVAAGGQVEHDGCAQRATLLQAPDHPHYELISGMTEEEVWALPARFHTPVFIDSCTPKAWVCAVCWGDGWNTQWPCKTAQEHGTKVFTNEHQAETAAKKQAAELEQLRARVAELETERDRWRQFAELDVDKLAQALLLMETGPALPWAAAMSDDDLHGFLGDLVSAAMGRWRSDPEVPDRTVLADIEKVCADWRTPGQGLRSDEPAADGAEDRAAARDCTTCEHYLPAMAAEEQCNSDGCGCTGYPEACDVRAAPAGAVFPISNCPSWQARE